MTASQQPDAEHAPLTSPAAAGSGPTGHDKAVEVVMDALGCNASISDRCLKHWAIGSTGWPCSVAVDAANAVRAHDRAALAAGDADVAGALGLTRRVMWDDNRSDRKGEAVWFQTTPMWTWTESP